MHCSSHGSGDAVLFIHGMPTNCRLWDAVIQQISHEYRCFAVDLPGLGGTPRVPYGPDYLDTVADQIEQIRTKHNVSTWHLVGHDAGSVIAAHYAGKFPGRVNSLALLSPAVFPDLKPYYLLNTLRKRLLGEIMAPLIHLIFWQVVMRRALRKDADQVRFQAFYTSFAGPAGAWRLMQLVRWGRPEDMLGAIPSILAKLEMPTLVFHGSRDVLPATFAQRAHSIIPRSSLITLDAGHFLPLDKPEAVAAGLRWLFAEKKVEDAETIDSAFDCGGRVSLSAAGL